MGNIICIKARSHSDFELYLIGEKYDIPYDFLIDYKKDREVYKFWTEVGSGIICALEERPDEKTRKFSPTAPMSEREKQSLLSIQPLRAGDIIRKYKGDIEEKEHEFKDMLLAKEKRKEQMLNRKYDPSDIVCINAKLDDEQIFAVCVSNEIRFPSVISFLENNCSVNITKIWFEKKTSELVAYDYIYDYEERSEINPSCLIPKAAIYKRSKVAAKTPKIKGDRKTLEEYQDAKERGYSLSIPKLDRMLESGFLEREEEPTEESTHIDLDVFEVDDLKELLSAALEDEDYESAAALRDAIKEMESKKKKQ